MNAEFEIRAARASGRPSSLNPGRIVRKSPHRGPQLLVSVRSVLEAQRAIAGGAEVLDVKEPSHGSLGMAVVDDIAQIANLSPIVSAAIPLSVALGEVADWFPSFNVPALSAGITFAKLGLSHCAGRAEWRADWCRVRDQFEQRSLSTFNWVAVAYADSVEAQAPCLTEVLEAAIETGCAGLLIDTWTKGFRTLFDFIDAPSMRVVADQCHAAGLFLAVAGKLDQSMLPALADVRADLLAIRSAACVEADRTSELNAERVREFRHEMRSLFEQPIRYPAAPV